MPKVITYGTYDLLHYGHIKLLERARALGDYLIVGVTADDFDRTRGKINVQQSLIERVEAVRQTGLADKIIVEEYEGQKIDDIKRFGVDIFTVGSDWFGKFDYLNEFCKVVYLDRTQGVSSSEIRSKKNNLRLGIIGYSPLITKIIRESSYVNGLEIVGMYTEDSTTDSLIDLETINISHDFNSILASVDALYILSHPSNHYKDVKTALENGKHVICESPVALTESGCAELFALAKKKGLVLADGIKTAYSTAYSRMILLAKGGKIGDIISVDAICTSLRQVDYSDNAQMALTWNSMTSWAPTALLPVFQLLGEDYIDSKIYSRIVNEKYLYDEFSKVTFYYPGAVASIKVGKGVKSEGELIISGTKGYIYVPAPWWKTDYFETRFENPVNNRRYFYQLDGEGIRNELVSFLRKIENNGVSAISEQTSLTIARIMEMYHSNNGCVKLLS